MPAGMNATPLNQDYSSTMRKNDLASTFAQLASTQFPSIRQARLLEIFSQTVKNVTEENEGNLLSSQQISNQEMLQEGQDNSVGLGYGYFASGRPGFDDEGNGCV